MAKPAGFTSAELVVVAAVIGLLFTAAMASGTWWRTSALSAGAEELKALLNAARQLAVAENTSVCVASAGAGVQFLLGGCTGSAWTGPGSRAGGVIPLASNVSITASSSVVFTYLGAAVPAGSYTIVDPRGDASVRVVVAASGRITVAR
jgi:Tfp pilus assembly protein FimT